MNVPQLNSVSQPGLLAIQPRGGPNRKHHLQQFFYCCYGRLPSDSSEIVDMFIGRYQADHVPFRDRCIATVLHATMYYCSSFQEFMLGWKYSEFYVVELFTYCFTHIQYDYLNETFSLTLFCLDSLSYLQDVHRHVDLPV
jgi:hypothetical protein